MQKMKPEIKELVVKALRSDEFKQGKGALRRDDEFCCLGVICELYRRETGNGEWVLAYDEERFTFKVGKDSSRNYLPLPVAEWCGMDTEDYYCIDPIINPDEHKTAADVNDLRRPFREIADLIERNL